MKRLHMLALIGAVVIVLGIAFAGRLGLFAGGEPGRPGAGMPTIGGPFTLTDQSGRTVTDRDFRGRYMLVYFGYTFCPDVCPTSLSTMATALEMVPKAVEAKIQPVFITVDPARDTVDVLKSYVANFHPRLVGLTGTEEQIKDAARKYRVYFQKADQGKDAAYLMDHSSIVYLMGPDGRFLAHFSHTTPPEQMAETIAKAVQNGGA
jgi:protein SCO1/2